MNTSRILLVEDEQALAEALAAVCRRLGADPTACYSGQRALAELAQQDFDLVILDIGLPDMNGLALLEKLRAAATPPPVLIITAHGNLENAVAAKKLGATEYLIKPLDLFELQETIRQLLQAPARASAAVAAADDTQALLIGGAPAMQPVFLGIAHACASDAPVLITGPTGTGKTVAARVIHANSARATAPFVTLHCGALPETLLESELFGHEKNAFTGALAARTGHLERAAGGTLLLDEIGDIPPAVQAKLLRFVEERVFNRVGGREDLTVDVRLIVATHRDLRAEAVAGRFREDLYYRLHVLEIELPPLAARREDIPALAVYFLGRLAPARPLALAEDTLRLLQQFPWPGNVRQLRNSLAHAVAVTNGPLLLPQHLPRDIRRYDPRSVAGADAFTQTLAAWLQERLADGATYDEIHDALEGAVLRELMRHFGHKPSALARALDMNRATLLMKRRLLGVPAGGAKREERGAMSGDSMRGGE